MRYRFGHFELDAARYELWRAGKLLSVQPKVFELLRYLIEHRDRIVSQHELLDALWAGQRVGETAVPWTIRQARNVLSQKSGERGPIETVHARGYRWLGSAEVLRSASDDMPFVGRQPLMAALETVLEDVQAGRGGLVLLAGDSGIGKTRCMDELAEGARARGYSVLSSRCKQGGAAPVYAPWIEALRSGTERQLQSQLTALLAMFDAARGNEHESERSATRSNHALFEAASGFLSESGRAKPCVLLLDDLHWADSGTLELIGFLAAGLRHARVLIVTASRTPVNVPTEMLRYAQRYELVPLSNDDVAAYFRAVVGEGEPSTELCVALQRASAGYPLFLEEVVRNLLAEHPRTAIKSLNTSSVVPGQHAVELLHARLAELPVETREALSCASVLGETFELTQLIQLCGMAPEALLTALERARQKHFILEQADQYFSFRHSLFRDFVYEQLPLAERQRLHRAAAHALQTRPDAESRRSEIAQHYHRSLALGEPTHVYAACLAAARAASNAAFYADAAKFAAWALEALALDDARTHRAYAELLLFRAYAQRCAGSPEDARNTLERLLSAASQYGFADLLVRAARSLRLSHGVGVVPDALAHSALTRVLELRVDEQDEQRIQAQCMLAWLPPNSYDMERSKQLSEHALSLAVESGSSDAVAEGLVARLYALSGPDDIASLLSLTQEILSRDPTQDLWLHIEALVGRHTALLHVGDFDAAQSALDTLRALANRRGYQEILWHCDRHAVQTKIASGDFATASTELEGLEISAGRIRLGSGVGLVLQLRVAIADLKQGPASSTGLSAFSRYRAYLATSQLRTTLQASVLRRELELGQRDAARSGLDSIAADDFVRVPKNLGYLCSLCSLAIVAIGVADRRRAERLYELLSPYDQLHTLNEFAVSDGPVAYYLALLAGNLGRDNDAERHFGAALAHVEKLGQRPQIARICLDAARFFMRSRGTKSVRSRALALCKRAAELAESLEMFWLAEEARALASDKT